MMSPPSESHTPLILPHTEFHPDHPDRITAAANLAELPRDVHLTKVHDLELVSTRPPVRKHMRLTNNSAIIIANVLVIRVRKDILKKRVGESR
jgi:hypothetical protein